MEDGSVSALWFLKRPRPVAETISDAELVRIMFAEDRCAAMLARDLYAERYPDDRRRDYITCDRCGHTRVIGRDQRLAVRNGVLITVWDKNPANDPGCPMIGKGCPRW